ncbi:dihydrolipoyl dehydrogenase family protein [Rhabdothermincola salaria]|uniref:dihydrolipoyl dehydrogenase family protein n=1 Tax=Rhabdothermincola salaria TaxID=2903142 RepID=UPI001E4F6507|nr:NAD(P)/FAD-dependent oxidoreductase [Rhabdothermincola salaria]MCD9624255.1 NAD(P)/FAD-dependent oxidoreductase [Rhabdothermincola salaria]
MAPTTTPGSDPTDTLETADVVVLGMGPGGEHVAGRLAEEGLDVVGIDAELVGGECPYWGCIPSKMMVRAADLLAEAHRIDGVAGHAEVHADFGPVTRRIRDEATDDWDDTVAVERFEKKGGTFVRGRGRLVGPDAVEVDGRVYRATRGVVLATGTSAFIPPIDGLADTPYWTNREAIAATTAPESIVVLGGGAIGAELAQVFARFGSAVTVVEAAERLLPLEEPEAGHLLAEVFGAEGIDVRTDVAAARVHHQDGRFAIELADSTVVDAERLLVATGRRADPAGIGAEHAGIAADARWVDVDADLRVAPGVWAVGDLTGKGAFTHVAMYQADIAIADILEQPHEPARYGALPRVTFTDPEVGSVGLSEADAVAEGITVAVGSTQVGSTARGWLHGPGNDGLIKLVADRDRGVLVGATSMGPAGGEVLGLLTLAVHAEIPLDVLRTMIYAYPTFHRGVEDALRDLDA